MFAEIILSPDDLNMFDWESLIRDPPEKTCIRYSEIFNSAARAAGDRGEQKLQQTLAIFGSITSMILRPAEKDELFAPMVVLTNGNRTATISDFTEQQLDVFKAWLPNCHDAELKARIADVIWTRKHQGNFQIAETAVESYLASGENLLSGEFPYFGVDRITRSLHLAASLGHGSKWFPIVVENIERLIERYAKEYADFTVEFIDLLFQFGIGDPAKYAPISESLALHEEERKIWIFARRIWEVTAKWYRKAKDEKQEFTALERIASNYVNEANEALKAGRGYTIAAHNIQGAIETLRRIPDTKEKQNQLHKVMLEYQEKSLADLGHVWSEKIDLKDKIENTINLVKNKPFFDAIVYLALFTAPASRARMAALVDEMMQKLPLLAWIGSSIVDNKGKTIGQRGSMFDSSEEAVAQRKESEMFQRASFEQNAIGAIVENTRQFLLTEHNPSANDFIEIVIHNPFIPPGREPIFAQGLLSGFRGDYLISLHLLIPQIENSIRYVLNSNNVITSSLNSEGIQEEFDLNKLLDMPETVAIFREDLIFGLKGMLTSRYGGNLRNKLAHGLLDFGQFYSYDAIYTWWLILKICCMPLIKKQESDDAAPKE